MLIPFQWCQSILCVKVLMVGRAAWILLTLATARYPLIECCYYVIVGFSCHSLTSHLSHLSVFVSLALSRNFTPSIFPISTKPLMLLTFNLALPSLSSPHRPPFVSSLILALCTHFLRSLSLTLAPLVHSLISLPTSKRLHSQSTFLPLQWSEAPSGTSRFTTQPPTLWTSAGRLPQVQSSSTGWSTPLLPAPGLPSRSVTIHRVGRGNQMYSRLHCYSDTETLGNTLEIIDHRETQRKRDKFIKRRRDFYSSLFTKWCMYTKCVWTRACLQLVPVSFFFGGINC